MEKEVTFRELVIKAGEFRREYWRFRWLILLVSGLVTGGLVYQSTQRIVRYTAVLTYTLNDGKSSAGALSGMLSSFGIGGVSKVNYEKLVSLSQSRNLIQKMLYTRIALDTLGGKEDFIANHLIRLHRFDEKWAKDFPGGKDIFFSHDSVDVFEGLQLSALKKLIQEVSGSKDNPNPVFSSHFDAASGILTMEAKAVDEQLSIEICRTMYGLLSSFYTSTAMQPQQSTLQYAKVKSDSVYQQLRSREYALSRFNDSHRNLQDLGVQTEKRLLESEILKLKTLYAEATKNRELAEFSLNSGGMAEMMLIDEPIMPLDSDYQPLWLVVLKGMVLGVGSMLLLISLRKMYKDAVAVS